MARKYGRSTRKGQRRKTRSSRPAFTGLARRSRRKSPRIGQLEGALTRARRRNRTLSSANGNPSAPKALGQGVWGGAAVVAGGGAAAGVVSELFPSLLGIDTRLVAGLGLVAWGAMSKDDPAQIAACLGAGMLACAAEDLTAGMVSGNGFMGFLTADEEAA